MSTTDQFTISLHDALPIFQTDAIVVNQSNKNEITEFSYRNKKVKYISFNERGVGLSRNNALMRASGDICLMRSEEHTSELQSRGHLVCCLLLEQKNRKYSI